MVGYRVDRKCTNDRILYSGFEFSDDSDTPVISTGSVKLQGRYSTPVLLLCWREYIEKTINVYDPEIRVLQKLAPPTAEMNAARKTTSAGYKGTDGVLKEEVRDKFPDAKSFVPQEWLFSTFVEKVKSGEIDCDDLPIIQKYISPHFHREIRNYRQAQKELGNKASTPVKYKPKKKNPPSTVGKTTTTQKTIIPSYINALSAAFDFTEKGIETRKNKKIPDLSNEDFSETFNFCLQNGWIKKVQFDKKKMKDFHDNDENGEKTPMSGAAAIIYKMKKQQSEARESMKIMSTRSIRKMTAESFKSLLEKTGTFFMYMNEDILLYNLYKSCHHF